jgi:glycosyltransferase involved in cell wall biosynthesis
VFTQPLPGAAAVETVDGVCLRRVVRTVRLGPAFGATFVASMAAALWRHRSAWDVAITSQAPWEAYATAVARTVTGSPTAVLLATSGSFGDLAQIGRTRAGALLRRLFLRNDRFLCLSDDAAAEAAAFGCPPVRVERVTYPVAADRFRPPADDGPDHPRWRNAVFVGRLAEQKNPLLLLEAWRRLGADDWRLRVVGDGPLRQPMGGFVRAHRLPNVDFCGRRGDIPDVLREAGVFVNPTNGEGCCNALLEAMAAGLCPITTRIGGNVGVFPEGRAGDLVPPGDADALAAALRRRLSDPAGSHAAGQHARAVAVAEHDPDAVAERYLQILGGLVQRRGATPAASGG